MLTLAPPSIKTSSTMFFPTYTWKIVIWLSTSIVVVSSSKCVSTIVATLGFDIYLIVILGFCSSFFTTNIFLDLVLSLTIGLTSKYR